MAKIKIDCCPCDQGQHGSTYYWCSECNHDCKDSVDKCPNCGVIFDEKSTFDVSSGFGNSDPERF